MHEPKSQKRQIGVFLGSLDRTERRDSDATSRKANGGVEGTELSVEAARVPKWAQGSQEGTWELGGTMGDGAGKPDIN
jgi:hypothetical protein